MNYMVFDLEFNQVFNFSKDSTKVADPRCPFEIIDIGAVKLDESLSAVEKFDSLIKPRIYTRIHPMVRRITGITREALKNAKTFKTVYGSLVKFMSNVDALCVWGGSSDIRELYRNAEYYGLDTSIIPKKYIDVQHYADISLKQTKGANIALSSAVEAFDIPVEQRFHDAFNDAFYTAEVFKKLGSNDITPEVYHFTTEKRKGKRKTINDDMLIKQFDNMFHRKMTPEEQNIIKMAYRMGRTNQFS